MLGPLGPNERWSLDFVSDQFADGRRFRILAIVDDYTPENLALVADTSFLGLRVARELDRVTAEGGSPTMIVSDNGSEFTSNAMGKLYFGIACPRSPVSPGKEALGNQRFPS